MGSAGIVGYAGDQGAGWARVGPPAPNTGFVAAASGGYHSLGLRGHPRGDLNCDGRINFADIDPFVLALSDPAAYQAAYPNCDLLNGDINADGLVDLGDIDPFVALLAG